MILSLVFKSPATVKIAYHGDNLTARLGFLHSSPIRLGTSGRRHWPKVHILVRGDSHYGRDEVMEWCEENQGTFLALPATRFFIP